MLEGTEGSENDIYIWVCRQEVMPGTEFANVGRTESKGGRLNASKYCENLKILRHGCGLRMWNNGNKK